MRIQSKIKRRGAYLVGFHVAFRPCSLAPLISGDRRMSRALSWVFALMAYFGPPTWAKFAIEADRKAQLAIHGYLCGNVMFGIFCLAIISSGVLSLVAAGFGIVSFRALPRPRTWKRIGELVILSLPLLAAVIFLILLFLLAVNG